jgi:hypothetical protein
MGSMGLCCQPVESVDMWPPEFCHKVLGGGHISTNLTNRQRIEYELGAATLNRLSAAY